MIRNNLQGTWTLDSASLINKHGQVPILGANPRGLLVFTPEKYFSVMVGNPAIAPFVSGDRLTGSDAENRAVVHNNLALFGTYEVDCAGDFLYQHILNSSFPNWTGLNRGTDQLQLSRVADTLLETMTVGDGVTVELVWHLLR